MSTKEQTFGSMPMSQGAYLYNAMSRMTSYDMQMQIQWLNQLIQQAKVAAEATNNFLTESFQAAQEQGETYRDDAKGMLGQAITGAMGVMAMGVSYVQSMRAPEAGELSQATDLKKALEATQERSEQVLTSDEGVTSPVTNLVKRMENGDKSAFADYQKMEVKEQQAALQQMSARKNVISKNLQDYTSDLEKRLQENTSKLNTMSTVVQQATNAGGSGVQSYYNFQKASDATDAQSDAARADVEKNLLQQQVGYVSDAQQKASAFFQDAGSIASGYAQIVSTHA